jgi:hypothetical protein
VGYKGLIYLLSLHLLPLSFFFFFFVTASSAKQRRNGDGGDSLKRRIRGPSRVQKKQEEEAERVP